jgi:arylformamidase
MTQFYCRRILDISLPLNEKTVVYPGNPPIQFTPEVSLTSKSRLTKISFGSHTGTHIDAPSHTLEKGKNIEEFTLSTFIGICRVLDVTACETEITVEDLEKHKIKKDERILVKTRNSDIGFENFYEDFVYLSSLAAKYLASRDIMLFGIDALSVKKRGLSDNTAHTALLSKNIPIIEGLNLQNIQAGEYFLVALPLEFTGIDGAPARVVLFSN